MNSYLVYQHASLSGKRYIGITRTNPKKRWSCGKGYVRNKYFYAAIKKYGWDNFSHEILYIGCTKKEAEKIEVDLIKKYCLTDNRFGYNIDKGGNGSNRISEETRSKISNASKKAMSNPDIRKQISQNVKKTMSNPEFRVAFCKKQRQRWDRNDSVDVRRRYSDKLKKQKECPSFKEKHQESLKKYWSNPENRKSASERGKKRLSDPLYQNKLQQARKDYLNTHQKKVRRGDGKIFESIKEAVNNTLNANASCISACCNGVKYRKTHAGYTWNFID